MGGVNFSTKAAKQIQKTVKEYLGEPIDQNGARPRRLSFSKPATMYCKIQSDFSDGYPAPSQIMATPCEADGTLLPDATAIAFDLTGHPTQLQAYCNLKAGDIVRFKPYNGSASGEIDVLPIVATNNQYAVFQVGTASGSGVGGRVVFDWVRAHA